jgi:hypothetical protein
LHSPIKLLKLRLMDLLQWPFLELFLDCIKCARQQVLTYIHTMRPFVRHKTKGVVPFPPSCFHTFYCLVVLIGKNRHWPYSVLRNPDVTH